jgi:hypothetical protein
LVAPKEKTFDPSDIFSTQSPCLFNPHFMKPNLLNRPLLKIRIFSGLMLVLKQILKELENETTHFS